MFERFFYNCVWMIDVTLFLYYAQIKAQSQTAWKTKICVNFSGNRLLWYLLCAFVAKCRIVLRVPQGRVVFFPPVNQSQELRKFPIELKATALHSLQGQVRITAKMAHLVRRQNEPGLELHQAGSNPGPCGLFSFLFVVFRFNSFSHLSPRTVVLGTRKIT